MAITPQMLENCYTNTIARANMYLRNDGSQLEYLMRYPEQR